VKRLSGVSGQSLERVKGSAFALGEPTNYAVVIVGYNMGKPIPTLQAVDGTSTITIVFGREVTTYP
jgi:hypothetical protein